jgi:hypothetical protein
LFDTDYSPWLYFGPLNYGGGPFLDLLKNAHTSLFGADSDRRIALERLKKFPLQMIPGSGFGRDVAKATAAPDLATAMTTFLGLPPSAEPKHKLLLNSRNAGSEQTPDLGIEYEP